MRGRNQSFCVFSKGILYTFLLLLRKIGTKINLFDNRQVTGNSKKMDNNKTSSAQIIQGLHIITLVVSI